MIGLLLATLIVPDPGDIIVPPSAIMQVVCIAKKGVYEGTAFRVGNGILLSVNHVTSSGNCLIDGKPISISYKSPSADFSMLAGDDGAFIKVDCGGFVKGRKYLALGYGRGVVSTITKVELVALGKTDSGEELLAGIFAMVPGQSGGPVLDEETGSVVGTVNMENYEAGLSWSLSLSDTPVCRKGAA